MRSVLARFVITTFLALAAEPGRAFSDAELVDGFNRTVFGSEYSGGGWQSSVVKKFAEPVRFYIDDRSSANRHADVLAFVHALPGLIDGLEVVQALDPTEANFRIFVVDRADYRAVVATEIYGEPSSDFAPGKCLVRVISNRNGITGADAVIVANEGDFLFRRCLTEEVLQGLGPVNDDRSLPNSVFNDSSPHAAFTAFDRHILNILYHPRVRPGMTKLEARRILPKVVQDVRARLAGS